MKIQITLSILLAAALMGGCKSPNVVQSGTDLGTLRGKVALFANCNSLSNASGATIHIQGTGFSTTTDTVGEWEIDNVPAGIYNIIIAKTGFDTDLVPEYQFSGDGTQFLEHEAVHATPMDSVLILSVQVTKKDSIDYRDSVIRSEDSLGHLTNDTIRYVYDTAGYEYFLDINLTMHGSDSAISFRSDIQDLTRTPTYPPFFSPSTYNISRNGTLVAHANWNSPLPVYNYYGYPQPGDSLVVTTQPISPCGGGLGPILSKIFVLP